MNKTIGWIIIILVVIGVFWWWASSKPVEAPVGGEVVKIGFIGPLTGPLAGMGEEQKNTIEIAVDEINQNGGVGKRKLEFVYEDGKCDGKEAATAAQKLINIEKIKILMPVCSSESLAIVPITEANKALVFAVWPTAVAFSGAGDYTFRNSYSDEDSGRELAQAVNAKYKTVGIITELTDYPVGLLGSFKKYSTVEIFEESYPPNSKDVRTQITKILSRKPEAILVNPNSPETGLAILQQLAQQGFKGALFGNFFATSNEVLGSPAAEGIIFSSDPDVKESSAKGRFLATYQSRYGTKPNLEFAVAAQYDAVYILKQAIEAVGDNPDVLKDYLHNLQDFKGLLGTYGFNEKGDMVGAKPALKQIKDGQPVVYQR